MASGNAAEGGAVGRYVGRHACAIIFGTEPCASAACLTFPVCRSHLGWWARHHPLRFVQLGARIRNISGPHLTKVVFDTGECVSDFCETFVDIRGESGCDTVMWLPVRPAELLVIADWLDEGVDGHDAAGIRSVLTPLIMAKQLALL